MGHKAKSKAFLTAGTLRWPSGKCLPLITTRDTLEHEAQAHEPFLCCARQTPSQRTESFTRILVATSGLQACLLPWEEAGDSQRALQDLGAGTRSSGSDSGVSLQERQRRKCDQQGLLAVCRATHPQQPAEVTGQGPGASPGLHVQGVELRLWMTVALQVNMDL